MSRTSIAVLSLCTLGAASPGPGVTVSATPVALTVDVGIRHTPLRFSLRGLEGEELELRWHGRRLEGHDRHAEVSLTARGATLAGNLGTAALTLAVTRTGDGAWLEGQWGDQPVALFVGPMALRGTFGNCTFTLKAAAGSYRGFRHCGSAADLPLSMTLTLPRGVEALDGAGLGAVLAVVLAPIDRIEDMRPRVTVGGLLLQRFGLALADEPSGGVRVTAVRPGSAAASAGIEPAMVVTRAGQEKVISAAQLRAALLLLEPDETMMLQLRHPGRTEWIELEIVAPPLPST